MSELTWSEREWLAWACSVAFDQMCSQGGFTEHDWAAYEKFKAVAITGGASTDADRS